MAEFGHKLTDLWIHELVPIHLERKGVMAGLKIGKGRQPSGGHTTRSACSVLLSEFHYKFVEECVKSIGVGSRGFIRYMVRSHLCRVPHLTLSILDWLE